MHLETLRAAVVRCFPELSRSTFTFLTKGWDSIAVDVDDRLIFKFPRDEEASARLRREASLLAVVRPAVTIRCPISPCMTGRCYSRGMPSCRASTC